MRRIFFTIAALIVLGGLAAFAYLYFFQGGSSVSVSGNPGFPLTGNSTTSQGGSATSTLSEGSTPVSTAASAKLTKIDAGPVTPGELVLDTATSSKATTSDTKTVFIERQSGNVFNYVQSTGTITRTSNRTVPGIEEASWLSDASAALVRYLSGDDFSTINTYMLPADGSTGAFLPQDISQLAVSGSSVLTLASGVNGSVATLMRPDGSGATQLFTTPLSSLRIAFAGKNQYLAFTKPSATQDGYAFLVDSKGNFSRIAGPLKGLVALPSPTGALLLVSYTDAGSMKTELINAKTREVIALPLATIADKCVWSTDETAVYCGVPQSTPSGFLYPDDWYQGAVHFSDRIWKIDVPGRFAQLVLDFSTDAKSSLDATALAIDPKMQTLVFFNKNDASLWSYKLQ